MHMLHVVQMEASVFGLARLRERATRHDAHMPGHRVGLLPGLFGAGRVNEVKALHLSHRRQCRVGRRRGRNLTRFEPIKGVR